MLCLCHRIIDLSNELCTKSDDKATFVQTYPLYTLRHIIH